MIMAARAGNGQAQKAASERVDPVVELIEHLAISIIDRTQREESKGGRPAGFVAPLQQVACDLLQDELVVPACPSLKALNQPVTVAKTLRIKSRLEAVGLIFPVTRHVQPMPAPAFPVMRAGQKMIHHLFKCIRRGIILKRSDLLGRGWQPYASK